MKLKLGLLGLILDNPNTPNKYSRTFLNLKNVFELENKTEFEFSEEFIKKFQQIEYKFYNFLNGIPLQVIEKYYVIHINNLDEYIFIDFQEKEISEMRVIDLYVLLENFFSEIFSLACEIADFYNLEVKINSNSKNENNFI